MKELIELIEARNRAPHVPYAIATVLRVEGSSYRRPGARMLINVNGRIAGSVSGGCLEKSVISQARKALLDNRSRLLMFDTTDQDDIALGSTMGCQGKIWIGIELLAAKALWPLETVVRMVRQKREPIALITRILGEGDRLHFESLALCEGSFHQSQNLPVDLQAKVEEVLSLGKSQFVGDDMANSALIELLEPPLSLLLFGGGADVPPMVRLARDLGHQITVIDRRPDFALPEQFPGADCVLCAKAHQISEFVHPDNRTIAVLMNHHYDTDRDVLAAILPLGLPYIALLGPRRRTERILREIRESGTEIEDGSDNVIHAPAGLDLGAESPEQIALSILAEIQASLAGREGGMLKYRIAPIHVDSTLTLKRECAVLV